MSDTTGQHTIPPSSAAHAQPSSPPWWVPAIVAPAVVALLVAGVGGLVTWGNASAEARHTRATVDQLSEQIESDRQRNDATIRQLEIKQATLRTSFDESLRRLDEIKAAITRIEDRLETRRHP